MATTDSAALVGVDVVTATISTLNLRMNRAGGTRNGTAATITADFTTTPVTNSAGGQTSTLDFSGDILRATALLELSVSGVVGIRGRFGIEFGDLDVTLPSFPGISLPTDYIRFWGIDVEAYFGFNGPSWSVPDFTGFDFKGFDFNLMLNMRNPFSGILPDLGSMKWFSFHASIPEISFLPFPEVQIPDFGLNLPTFHLTSHSMCRP